MGPIIRPSIESSCGEVGGDSSDTRVETPDLGCHGFGPTPGDMLSNSGRKRGDKMKLHSRAINNMHLEIIICMSMRDTMCTDPT